MALQPGFDLHGHPGSGNPQVNPGSILLRQRESAALRFFGDSGGCPERGSDILYKQEFSDAVSGHPPLVIFVKHTQFYKSSRDVFDLARGKRRTTWLTTKWKLNSTVNH
jgi:hypothetical protein